MPISLREGAVSRGLEMRLTAIVTERKKFYHIAYATEAGFSVRIQCDEIFPIVKSQRNDSLP